jgi:hypothetical protein
MTRRMVEELGLSPGVNGRARTKTPRERRAAAPIGLANYVIEGAGKDSTKTGLSARAIASRLDAVTHGWPKRIDRRLFVPDGGKPLWLESSDQLFAWMTRQLPVTEANGLLWATGESMVSRPQFDAYLEQTVERFDALESLPHEPAIPGHYYLHPKVLGGNGKALRGLLARFNPATGVDFDLIKAMALTLFWGGAPGQRPAFLIDADDDDGQGGRGVGKTKLGMALAHLAGGHIDIRANEHIDKLMTRLLSAAALDRRVAMLDNVKTLRFSWADLEALITADVLSGRMLYVGEGRRPNTLVWVITLNRASLSRDMAQRCVPIHLSRPAHDPAWEADTWAYIDAQRWAIIGDILAELRRKARVLERYSRWSAWEAAVLARVAEPAECQKVIAERQDAIDDDQAEAALVREGFVRELQRRGHDPEAEAIWIPSADAAAFVNAATGEQYPVRRASVYLATLTIRELRKSDVNGSRGWCWRGLQCPAGVPMVDLGTAEPEWHR